MALLTVTQALQLLQLEPGASKQQIRAAYKRLALQLHPDKQHQRPQQTAEASSSFALLSAAYSLLLQGQRCNTPPSRAGDLSDLSLPPFETAYATGSLFCEQLLDEAVLMGCCPADIVTLQTLCHAAAAGQLAQLLATSPPTAAEEALWRQAYLRLQCRQQAAAAAQQANHQQQQQQQVAGGSGVGVGQLLSDLLLRPMGPLYVVDSDGDGTEEEEEQAGQQQHQDFMLPQVAGRAAAAAAAAGVTSALAPPLQQQQQSTTAAGPGIPVPVKPTGRPPAGPACQQQKQQQQQQHVQQQHPVQQQQQHAGLPGRPCQAEQQQPSKRLRHGWGFYWQWVRRGLIAKALLSLLTSSLKARHGPPHALPLPPPLPLR